MHVYVQSSWPFIGEVANTPEVQYCRFPKNSFVLFSSSARTNTWDAMGLVLSQSNISLQFPKFDSRFTSTEMVPNDDVVRTRYLMVSDQMNALYLKTVYLFESNTLASLFVYDPVSPYISTAVMVTGTVCTPAKLSMTTMYTIVTVTVMSLA